MQHHHVGTAPLFAKERETQTEIETGEKRESLSSVKHSEGVLSIIYLPCMYAIHLANAMIQFSYREKTSCVGWFGDNFFPLHINCEKGTFFKKNKKTCGLLFAKCFISSLSGYKTETGNVAEIISPGMSQHHPSFLHPSA